LLYRFCVEEGNRRWPASEPQHTDTEKGGEQVGIGFQSRAHARFHPIFPFGYQTATAPSVRDSVPPARTPVSGFRQMIWPRPNAPPSVATWIAWPLRASAWAR